MSFEVSVKELLEAGVQFGHSKKKSNPKMGKFIFSQKNDIYIIDLEKVLDHLRVTYEFVKSRVKAGGLILFVGTKKQIQDIVKEEAQRCNMPYIVNRWLGGTLTNFEVISNSVRKLLDYQLQEERGNLNNYSKKEARRIKRRLQKLENLVGGIKNLNNLPSCLYIIDTKKERTALHEAKKLNIPTVAIVDTDEDPEEVTYPIPGNDDAVKSVRLITKVVTDAVIEGIMERGKEVAEEELTKQDLVEAKLQSAASAQVKQIEVPKEIEVLKEVEISQRIYKEIEEEIEEQEEVEKIEEIEEQEEELIKEQEENISKEKK